MWVRFISHPSKLRTFQHNILQMFGNSLAWCISCPIARSPETNHLSPARFMHQHWSIDLNSLHELCSFIKKKTDSNHMLFTHILWLPFILLTTSEHQFSSMLLTVSHISHLDFPCWDQSPHLSIQIKDGIDYRPVILELCIQLSHDSVSYYQRQNSDCYKNVI